MSTSLRRSGGFIFALLVGLGFDLSDFVGSTVIAYSVWAAAVAWAVYISWPTLKRWRPFTLAPISQPQNAAPQPTATGANSRQAQEPSQPQEQDAQTKATLEEREREIRRLTRQLQRERSGGEFGATITSAEIPEGMVAERHIVGGSHLLERVLELAD